MTGNPGVPIYSLENYTFGVKEASADDRAFHRTRLETLKRLYPLQGMGRAVEIVAAVHLHNHPHILLLQHQNAFFLYKCPYYLVYDDDGRFVGHRV